MILTASRYARSARSGRPTAWYERASSTAIGTKESATITSRTGSRFDFTSSTWPRVRKPTFWRMRSAATAVGPGVVVASGQPLMPWDTGYGVVVDHGNGIQTWYWHLSSELVRVGQEVETGDLLGYEGRTGLATGCHLHFEVLFDEEPVNPRSYLP